MQVTTLGHAGLRVATAAASVLIDPWFSPEGAFLGSWFPYPDNSHLLDDPTRAPVLVSPSAVVVSHEHLDHLDPWFIARLDPQVPVVTCAYPVAAVASKLRHGEEGQATRAVIAVPAWEQFEVAGGLRIFFVPEESPMNHDAAVVVTGEGRALVNLNDARLSPAQLRAIRAEVGGHVDMLCLQGAGASWFPLCYRYPAPRRQELSAQKRMAKLAYVGRAVAAVEPTVVVPFAGPPSFLDPDLARHNEERDNGIFPDQAMVGEWLGTQGIENVAVMLPGDRWDLNAPLRSAKAADPHWADFSFADRSYESAYAARRRSAIEGLKARHPHPAGSLWEPFRTYFERLLPMNGYFNRQIDMLVGFNILGPGGGQWSVDFREDSMGVLSGSEDCAYTYQFESRWLPTILSGETPWEDFFLSLRFEAWRDPDVYNDHLLGLLKFADPAALDPVEKFERTLSEAGGQGRETFLLRADGRNYRVQRRCPHAGQDLSETGQVLEGAVLRCLAHHYEFDLNSGSCLNGRSGPLYTEELGS